MLKIAVNKELVVSVSSVYSQIHLFRVLIKFYKLPVWFITKIYYKTWLKLSRGIQEKVLHNINMTTWIGKCENLTAHVIMLFVDLYFLRLFSYFIKPKLWIWRSHKWFLRLIFAQEFSDLIFSKIIRINLFKLFFKLLLSYDWILVRVIFFKVYLIIVKEYLQFLLCFKYIQFAQ